jgi:CheY-like chemotaxis protein
VNVLSVPDSREVLSFLDHYRVAALIIDAQLSLMNGFDLARAVQRQAKAHGPAIVIITDVQWSTAQKSVAVSQMGLLDLLVKPVQADEVADLLVSKVFAPAASAAQGLRGDTLVTGKPKALDGFGDPDDAGDADDADDANANDIDDVDDPDDEPGPADFLADRASHVEKRHVERATEKAQAGQVELRGNLASASFPMLLHRLYGMRATGALFLLSGRIKKIVYFNEGHPTYIKSNRLSECLGKILVREGMISEIQCKQSLRKMAESVRQQGTVLIEMGVITPHDLVVGLVRQLRGKLMDIFTWTRGEYLFKSEAQVPSEIIRLDVSNATLIADGVRTCWDSERIEKALQPFMNSYPICSPSPEMRFQELELNPQELSFLECIDGSRTLRQLLSDTSLPRVKACAQQPEALQEHPTVPSPAKEENVRETLAAQLVSLQQRDAFGVLGLPAGANDDQVHQAYSDLATEYHPDRFRHLSAETRQMAQQIFDLISGAYQRVASVELRGLYRKESSDLIRIPGSAGGSAGGSVGGSALVAEQHRKDGLALMQQGRWGEGSEGTAGLVHLKVRPGKCLHGPFGHQGAAKGREPGSQTVSGVSVPGTDLRRHGQEHPGRKAV